MRTRLISLTAALLLANVVYAEENRFAADLAKNAPGASDSAIIGRFEGSFILGQQKKSFDELPVPTGPEKSGAFTASAAPQGTVTRTLYIAPAERSTLEIVKTYEEALKGQGFAVAYTCAKEQCGEGFARLQYGPTERLISNAAYGQPPAPRASMVKGALEYVRDVRYLAAKKTAPEGETWVAVYAAVQTGGSNGDTSTALTGSTQALVEIVEPKVSDAKLVTLKAEDIGKGMEANGKVAFYGVYFDHDKATIKPESASQLAEMAKFLQAKPEMNVFIVGHTDGQGTFEHNLTLSEARAAAVRDALVKTHAIDAKRLAPKGVASLAPVASNATEEGRAKNRRVELVGR